MKHDSKQSICGDRGRLIGARGGVWSLAGAVWLVSSGLPASAHPGHGLTDAGVVHLITSPYHLLVLAAAGLAVGMGARWVKSSVVRRGLQAGAALACGIALGAWLS